MKRYHGLVMFCCALMALGAWACGPFLSSAFISNPQAVLAPPETHFVTEMKQIKKLPDPPQGVSDAKEWPAPLNSTLEVDVADLEACFKKSNHVEGAYRETLQQYAMLRRMQLEQSSDRRYALPKADTLITDEAIPRAQWIAENKWPDIIPLEFQLYVTGAHLCYQGDKVGAREQWTKLLALSLDQRKYRSVWAAWMMGRTAPDADEALRWYREVGRLVAEDKCLDSLRIAAAAAGRLAKFEKDPAVVLRSRFYNFRENQRVRYEEDLLTLKKDLLKQQDSLAAAAESPDVVELMSAMLMQQGRKYYSGAWYDQYQAAQPDWRKDVQNWMSALKHAKVPDKTLPPQLGIAAYRVGDYEMADAVLKQATITWESCWIRGKLALQKGNQNEGARFLAEALRLMPKNEKEQFSSITQHEAVILNNDWWVGFRTNEEWNDQTVQDAIKGLRHSRLLADMATVKLAQSDFVSALKIFVQADCPHDAAYVAERLLSNEELLSAVRKWGWKYNDSKPAPQKDMYEQSYLRGSVVDFLNRQDQPNQAKLLYLTARKLSRDQLFKDARQYYPVPLLPFFDRYVALYRRGHNNQYSQEIRAKALWEAARLERSMGSMLFGTDGEPDGELYGGNFSYFPQSFARKAWAGNKDFQRAFYQGIDNLEDMESIKVPLKPSKEEIYRLNQYPLKWEKRFHYRYTASDLAWEAAALMPSNSEETAAVYGEAGKWIYLSDPKAADRFYKKLIWRNWNTPLAREADKLRWFPHREIMPRYNPFVAINTPVPGDE